MLNNLLTNFFERDIRKLIEEINLFSNEEDLWKTQGSIKNTSGNLALHIIGGTNYLIGTLLANTGYVRNRDQEFTMRGVPRKDLVNKLAELIPMINETLATIDMGAQYPMMFDGANRTNGYVLIQLLAHLNYHLGQVNYIRRILET